MKFEYRFLLDLALILIFTKTLGLLSRKAHLSQVVGFIFAGILLGPMCMGLVKDSPLLKGFGEIGVILILFSAGLSTNLKEMKKDSLASFVITILGVVVPLGLGFIATLAFINKGFSGITKVSQQQLIQALFYGIILTATSVGITAEALKEIGKLNTKVGSSIMAAAIIDDILGIVLLSVVIGLNNKTSAVGVTLLNVLYFLLAAIAVGLVIHFIFKFLAKKFPEHRRLTIFSLAICFIFAWAAESWFSIAAITGAYVAGIFMSNLSGSDYVEKRIDIGSYIIFGPIFFARIGISTERIAFNSSILWFSIAFVLIGLMSKFFGAGLGAKMCGYSWRDSSAVGVGMMVRGEVALVVLSKGESLGAISSNLVPAVISLIIISSLLAPIFMKLIYKNDKTLPLAAAGEYSREVIKYKFATAGFVMNSQESKITHCMEETNMPPIDSVEENKQSISD